MLYTCIFKQTLKLSRNSKKHYILWFGSELNQR